MAERFYVNWDLGPGPVELDGPEAHHLAVSRVRAGDTVRLFNGDGREYVAVVLEAGRRFVRLAVGSVESPGREVGYRLEVAAPLPKGDRSQFLVEKLTEVGATGYTPLLTARSVVQPREAKRDKLQRYVIEASKQCGRNVLMRVDPPMSWSDYCRRADLPPLRLIAHLPEDGHSPQTTLPPRQGDVALAVGPEGGFTEEEVAEARAAGWLVVGMGPRVLRVETAALVLAAWWANGVR